MAQECMNDFMAMAKDYAKAEKDLEVQRWVYIGFKRKDVHGSRVRIFSYDLPREVYERRRWVVKWREARLRCKYPKDDVQCYFSFYDKRLGNVPKLTEDLRSLVSAKAQVTKVQRKIDEYVAWHRANDMFFNERTDLQLIKMLEKLSLKRESIKAAEEKMRIKIQQIKEQRNDKN